ncbi:hypothetical protein J437_LFUL000082 [Ladona fulva]|uniref:PiggyBac transposable element-derived protein domain-containing protein n=1 Tax=Ladona fulva TaxID=123851 RepID=A0A8K0P033_LADFU|nr:hypothetical protein J437_LFUL000082 [Ladona fulva]
MKRYILQKRHKYGVKLYKLCFDKGITWNMKIYTGKDAGRSAPTAVVMELAERLLDAGRKLITDNYYTSLELAELLINRKTHLLGAVQKKQEGATKRCNKKEG